MKIKFKEKAKLNIIYTRTLTLKWFNKFKLFTVKL